MQTADVMTASSEVERTVQQLQSQRDQAALQVCCVCCA